VDGDRRFDLFDLLCYDGRSRQVRRGMRKPAGETDEYTGARMLTPW
jgi:hypothetical protein